MALKQEGSLYVWGDNSEGAFGNGTNINSNIPVINTLHCQLPHTVNETLSLENTFIKAYSNPFINEINFISSEINSVVSIFDMYGKEVYKQIKPSESIVNKVHLKPGIYLLQYHHSSKSEYVKMIKL